MMNNSQRELTVGAGITAAVSVVLAMNNPVTVPQLDIAAVWGGAVSLALLALNSIHARLKVVENRVSGQTTALFPSTPT